ncbi:glycerophosphodiester phosphodiesterase [Streptosporangium sp. NBC_01755]|uniref:glycerophosphodiester phosphodiesterase n=1 Tax=unclassified Streptosporangium TaxID=2632669 RepID=UPI002DD9C52E|nr:MULTISPECIES: glycerophosphodiester phosphodiesterase [unclassified Streptosporangium]WSA26638.1 glycerophosphodiester phosphodiesterase [Streptosporangium sp. NBC_01810]WSD01938.1 glycerophosphodiester phosphodiesterase [Streptosporangium sp. NBC_01755]
MIRRFQVAVLAVLATGTVAFVSPQSEPAIAEPRGRDPIVIGHRGASAHRPEHTLLSYEAAIALGADYIEPDLVSTKDHVLVARHENEIGGTTDVENHPEFADRRTTKTINGRSITGWFTEDFTLAELKTLRAEERIPDLRPGNTVFNGLAEIPTFDEVVALARRHGVGVYPETKSPSYFGSIGLSLEGPLLEVLGRHGWSGSGAPVFIQSFETANLRELSKRTELPLIQLITAGGAPYDWIAAGDPRTYDTMVTPAGLREVAGYADGVGVDTRRIVPAGPDGRLLPPTTFIRDAHEAGLKVHAWTVRNENSHLPLDFRLGNPASPAFPRATGDVMGWLERLYRLGLDGVFADDPGMARAVRARVF